MIKNNKIKEFIESWTGRGNEKQDTQSYWNELLAALGADEPTRRIKYEKPVRVKTGDKETQKYIDAYIPETKVLIEQKDITKSLTKPTLQSDGVMLTPYEQGRRYGQNLPQQEVPRYIVTSNFKTIMVHDNNRLGQAPHIIKLEDLDRDYTRLSFLLSSKNEHLEKEKELSLAASSLIGKIYSELLKGVDDPEDPETLESLNVLAVRLTFLLYAEDAGLLQNRMMFYDYMNQFRDRRDIFTMRLEELFNVLDEKIEERYPFLDPNLKEFPYINGALFRKDPSLTMPNLTDEAIRLILDEASLGFDWAGISPTIFGAAFESTLNAETRHDGGMHYTSIENIHKVIDPLFLDDLKEELEKILKMSNSGGARTKALDTYHNKLGELTFLDPACGSGNFLTETFLSLKSLENKVIEAKLKGQVGFMIAQEDMIKVTLDQFHGIEINDWAVSVAKTALWIAEHQALLETQRILNANLDFLPLSSYTGIVEGNALKLNWADVVDPYDLDYIIGNPPFLGARLMSSSQKKDLVNVFGEGFKNVGNLDFVSGWFKLSYDFLKGNNISASLVSTNSIVQGEAVGNLWKPLFEDGLRFNFAYPTFKWNNGSKDQAQVYCVILGFSDQKNSSKSKKLIYEDGIIKTVENINGYLTEGENIFVESRKKPITKGIPEIGIGNKPIDGGNYLFKEEEMKEFIKQEPKSQNYFRPWYGSTEFIKSKPRFCLWLGDATPAELRSMPKALKRVEAVRNFRLNSKSPGTRKIADKPTRFHVENMPNSHYLLIPRVSTSKRRYIPIGFMNPDQLASDSVHIIPNAELYHFAILTSNVHMAWMRRVAGRLGDGYRYSKDVVYNNFPWPKLTKETKAQLTRTAQKILDARDLYPDSSLADLYDEAAMPAELRKAHRENDAAVMQAYGWNWRGMSEEDAVAQLMKLYSEKVK